jgi:mRNA-degrading endonuclease RelE of RelBE toxin-antitoxin system
MQNNSSLRNIDLTPEYKRNLKDLAKKYRNIRSDTQPLIMALQKGDVLGDRISGFGSDIYVYKVRVKYSNIQKGKSGGYRLIYHVQGSTIIIMMTIYTKSEKEDISAKRIREILAEYENNNQ